MAKDDWIRTVHVTLADLDAGDWDSRERNPIALAMRRVLRPGVTLFVDLRQEEFFLESGTHRDWFILPDEVRPFVCRVLYEDAREELVLEMALPPWALPTARWAKKQE